MRTAIAVLALMLASSAQAANFKLDSFSGPHPIISVSGQIEDGDEFKFKPFTQNLSGATVQLDSLGGNVIAAIKIGEMIHKQGYSTYVPANTKCASACALIWIAGSNLSTASTGSVGFHAAYVYVDGKPMEKGLGNALVGAYLSKLGLSYAAIAFATAAGPNEISWLSPVVARDIGITYFSQVDDIVTVRTADTATPVSVPATPAPATVAPQQTTPVALITAPLDFHARTWPQIATQYIAQQPDVDFGSCNEQQVIQALQMTTFGQPVWAWAEVGCSPSKRTETQAGPVQLPDDFIAMSERFVVQHPDWDFSGCTRRTLATAMVSGSFGGTTGCMPKLLARTHAG